jgi:hypothetical protein
MVLAAKPADACAGQRLGLEPAGGVIGPPVSSDHSTRPRIADAQS